MRSVAVILDRQQVEFVHDRRQVPGAHTAHIVLLAVQVRDLFVDERRPALRIRSMYGRVVAVARSIWL